METAIGVFSSRERAANAVRELLGSGIPEEEIIFLTRSESEATTSAKQAGATVGGFMGMATGMSAGVAAATLMLTGVGAVFVLGFGAAALLGLAGAGAGAAAGKAAAHGSENLQPTPDEKCSDDVLFFREVLKEGRSLVVVRTESKEQAVSASAILDRLGHSIQGKTPVKMNTNVRHVEDIAIVDVSGRITVGEGNIMLRELVRELAEAGHKKIALNLHEVGYVDSSGIGELVKTYTTVRNQGGQLKLVNPSKRVQDLLDMTRLTAVFNIEPDEASAIQAFSTSGSKAVA
ncbi:MAG TPA: STAS domain-containing protein [Terriglobales bacterium]|nr:STAS domain-containing protein [Terriglobales bacterium]